MIPIDIQVSRSKIKVIGHVGIPRLVQLITPVDPASLYTKDILLS